jgi:HTH-type transcriptional regulator / antitoxin HigA
MAIDLHPIKTETDYQAALEELESLLKATPGTSAANRLELLSILIEAYEQQHHAINLPDPIAAILYYLESRGLSAQNLQPILGDQQQVTDLLSRRQPLTLDMIRQLHHHLGIPADILIQPYALEQSV